MAFTVGQGSKRGAGPAGCLGQRKWQLRLPSNQKYDFNIVCTCVRVCVFREDGWSTEPRLWALCVLTLHDGRTGFQSWAASAFLECLHLPYVGAHSSDSPPSHPAPGRQGMHDKSPCSRSSLSISRTSTRARGRGMSRWQLTS